MDYKTKIKITAVIGIIVVAVIFVLMVLFVTSNKDKGLVKTSNNKQQSVSHEKLDYNINLDEIESFGVQSHYIVAINANGESEKIYDIENKEDAEFQNMVFDDGVLYLVFNENSNTNIYSFNLNKKESKLTNIFETNLSEALKMSDAKFDYENDTIDVFNGNLYLKINNSFIEYNISKGSFSNVISNTNTEGSISGEVNSFVIDKSNKKAYISASIASELDGGVGVYSFDFETRELNQLITLETSASDLILGNNVLAICVPEYKCYYLYNMDEGQVYEIGDEHITEKKHGMLGKIVVCDDFLIYNNEEKIVMKDFEGNTNKELFTISNEEEGYYYNISMLTDNSVQVIVATYDSEVKPYKSIILNLDTNDITEIDEVNDIYFKIIRVK